MHTGRLQQVRSPFVLDSRTVEVFTPVILLWIKEKHLYAQLTNALTLLLSPVPSELNFAN